MAKIDSIWI